MFAQQATKSRSAGSLPWRGSSPATRPSAFASALGNRALLRVQAQPQAEGLDGTATGSDLQAMPGGDPFVLRRQPATAIEGPKIAKETTTRTAYHGSIADEVRDELSDLAEGGVKDFAPYKKALLTATRLQKQHAYQHKALLEKLAAALPLTAYDECINLLAPDPRTRAIAAMVRMKQKYGLAEVSEDGAQWTEAELTTVDRRFAKMPPEESSMLHDVYLVRKDKFPDQVISGKKFTMNAYTSGASTIQLTRGAIDDPLAVLHEVGHLIQQKLPVVAREALGGSPVFKNMQAASQKLRSATFEANATGSASPEFTSAMDHVTKAIQALADSPPDSMQNRLDQLDAAESEADAARPKEQSKTMLAAYERLKDYGNAVEQWVAEKQRIENAPADIQAQFTSIVKANRLNRRASLHSTATSRRTGRPLSRSFWFSATPRGAPTRTTSRTTRLRSTTGSRAAGIWARA